VAISGATNSTYTITPEDSGKIIFFEVTPVASTGILTGSSILSNGLIIPTPVIETPVPQEEADIELIAEPESIVGDGKSKTTLKAIVKTKDGNPVEGVTVVFSAEAGTLNQPTALTNAKGEASITLTSPRIESVSSVTKSITATVNDVEKNLIANEQLNITFLPASIEGVIKNEGRVVANATVTVSEDFDGDGDIDFSNTVMTDEYGHYKMAVPKSNYTYSPKVTIPILINGVETVIQRTQQAEVGATSGTGENVKSEMKFAGQLFVKNEQGQAVLLDQIKDHNGHTPNLNIKVKKKNQDGTYTEDGNVDVFIPSIDGAFELKDLQKNQEYEVVISMDVPDPLNPSQHVTLAGQTMKVMVSEDGEMSVGTQLIDPYGTITDSVTGTPISDVKVTLYWADTANNAVQSRPEANKAVVLPLLPDFPPNNNANPQITDVNGMYAWMVYGNGDYYIVAEKVGYQKYDSRYNDKNTDLLIGSDSWIKNGIIHVGETIVPYSFNLSKVIVPDTNTNTTPIPTPSDTTTYVSFTGLGQNITDVTPYITGMGEAGSNVAISVDKVPMGVVKVLDNGSWSFNVEKELAKGNHEVQATITDQTGNKKTVATIMNIKEPSTLNLKAPVRYLMADGKAVTPITVQFLTKSGKPLKNAEVVLKSEHGTLSLTRVKTNEKGFATLQYKAPLFDKGVTKNDTIIATVRNVDNFLSFNTSLNIYLISSNLKFESHYSYIRGYKDGTFKPENLTTRGEVAAMIARMIYADEPSHVSTHVFKDVSPNNWAYKYVQVVNNHLIMSGQNGNFRPNDYITRAELAVVIARYLKLKIINTHSFTDTKGHWAEEEIEAVSKLGLMSGKNKKFKPNDKVSRAEIVTIFNKMLGRVLVENPSPSIWKDVSESDSAYWNIDEASRSHTSIVNEENIEKWYEGLEYTPW
ncbi:MAG TPA: S-layer homology domain-containing protein, partial [Pseudoneobacillus sp.]|nr:S-layer homology domain-containing protein [Pseudoneobacillus sp.]